ncbi:MAG: surface-adhesin E family protein [Caldimonas sp.]
MPIRPSLLVLACLAVPALAFAAKWEKVGDAGPVSVYVDKDSVRRSGSEARAWLEWRWSRPTDVPNADPPRQYRLERQVQISNCANRSYAVAEGTRYADERGLDPVSSYKYDESALPYTAAVPRTVRDQVVSYVCAVVEPAKK